NDRLMLRASSVTLAGNWLTAKDCVALFRELSADRRLRLRGLRSDEERRRRVNDPLVAFPRKLRDRHRDDRHSDLYYGPKRILGVNVSFVSQLAHGQVVLCSELKLFSR